MFPDKTQIFKMDLMKVVHIYKNFIQIERNI